MLSAGAPSEELPKNRLAVFTEKPSRDGAGSSASGDGIGRALQVIERLGLERHRNIVLRKRRRAQRFLKFGIERRVARRPAPQRRSLRPSPKRSTSTGSSSAGAAFGRRRRSRAATDDEAIALQRAIDLGKSEA